VIYKPFDIVVVPFPFTDSANSKRRPAIVLSSYTALGKEINHSVMAMITSARNKEWPLDVAINDLKKSGLPKTSVIRMKFFTIDHRLIIEKIGTLATADRVNMRKIFSQLFHELV
jgi:mRNA interferase MazF